MTMMNEGRAGSIGVFILTKNEEIFIDECLKSCRIFSKIVVVDSCSTDRTKAICQSYSVDFYERPFTNFLEQRQFGVSKLDTDWIFYLDADEKITPELEQEILKFSEGNTGDLLEIPRKNFVLGHWIEHCGWYPDYQSRLIKADTLQFEENIVHERMQTTGKLAHLDWNPKAVILHQTCTGIGSYLEKMNHYTQLEADSYGANPPFKLTRWGVFSRSFGMFTQTLFHFKGIRDGFPGFIVACFNFITSMMVMIKCWEIQNSKKG